jgi:hypothetical protein
LRSSSQAATLARASASRLSRISATIAAITTTSVPNANRPRLT